ncbi:MAG: hypothetical protein VXX58_05535, partial [Pseudomonadota bacterium]|nr:hypothetical protein [Pseudomonadota bacterium]
MSDQGDHERALPSDDELIQFINDQDHDPTVKEIARAFGLKPHQRAVLRKLLKSLEGKAHRGETQHRRALPNDDLPTVLPLKIIRVTSDGAYL